MKNNPYVLITGAASGFGKEFAFIFAREGFNLVLVDLEREQLYKVVDDVRKRHPGVDVRIIVKNLGYLDSAYALYHEIRSNGITIDILVNNAGFGENGLFTETHWEKEEAIIITNVITVAHLTKLFLREMVDRNEGKILQVASVSGFLPSPRMAVYGATKSFVLFFSEALQHEIKDTNVSITILSPGASDTDFFRKANAENTVVYQDTSLSDPHDVAQAGFDALMKGKKNEFVGFKNELQVGISNLVPDSWAAAAMAKLFDEKESK